MKYCLLGRKLLYSYSELIHKKAGLDYTLKEIEPEYVGNFVKNNEYDGYNVTIPYKETVMGFLGEISEDAQKIGSVNTVCAENGKIKGYNTDCAGLKYLFDRAGVSLKNKRVLILGSGGTYKTANYLCNAEGALSVNFVSRTGDINYENCYEKAADAEILINCTPVGTFPKISDSPVEIERFKNLSFVADCVYNPIKTALTVAAENAGIKNSNGLPMLVYQALKAEEIWTGAKKTDMSESIIREVLSEKGNIVLYGMPSSGKTTVGKAVAERLKREFIDTDDLIRKKTFKTPAEIIRTSGEKFFRDIESEIIKEIAPKTGAVIATGGGAVIRAENVNALKLNGVLIYLKRDLKILSAKNRPLTQKYGAEKLYKERKDIYEKIKDAVVINDKSVEEIAEGVINAYENSRYKRC